MPLPTNGFRQPVCYCDEAGNTVDIIFDPINLVWRLCVDAGLGGGGGVNATLIGNQQVPHIETVIPLSGTGGPNPNFISLAYDLTNFAGYGISVYIQRLLGDTNVDVFVEDSSNGANWRLVKRINLVVTAAEPEATLGRVYSPVRQWMRVRLVNNTVNALLATELCLMLKPIP